MGLASNMNFKAIDTKELNSTNPYLRTKMAFTNEYLSFKLHELGIPIGTDFSVDKNLCDLVIQFSSEGDRLFDWIRNN